MNENNKGLITETIPTIFIDNEQTINFGIGIEIENKTVLSFGIVEDASFSSDSRIVEIQASYQPALEALIECVTINFKHGIFSIQKYKNDNCVNSKPFNINVSKNCLRVAVWIQEESRSHVPSCAC